VNFVDLHHHLIWGLDDGPSDREGMIAMLRAAEADGTSVLAATPHVFRSGMDFDLRLYRERLEEARALCGELGLSIQLMEGAEIRYSPMTLTMLQDGRVPTLGGSEYVLIEFWHDIAWNEVYEAVERLYRYGYIPVIAHVERYRCFVHSPRRALKLREEYDVCCQVNAETILAPQGFFTKRFLSRMLEEEGVDLIASDAHDCLARPTRMRLAHEAIGKTWGRAYADRLMRFDVAADLRNPIET